MPEEQKSMVPAHGSPTGSCVQVSLFLSRYEIKQAVNRAVEAMAAGVAVLKGHLGRRLDINQSNAVRAASANLCLSSPYVGHPRDPWRRGGVE